MKRLLFTAAVLFAAAAIRAQEIRDTSVHGKSSYEKVMSKGEGLKPEIETWRSEGEFVNDMRVNPTISMTSTMEVIRKNLPTRVIVLPNNSVRVWHVNVSNGSAGNWGSFPNSYLDARTLSFPAPR
ncbi:MAG: hypothetical protein J6K28_04790 [Alistipes sp.]|nr:hypothetical protein [Alistipes sp.]